MCRYAFAGPYKIHYACFECRKAFKLPSIEDWLEVQGYGFVIAHFRRIGLQSRIDELEAQYGVTQDELESRYREAAFNCPECKQPMASLGRDFKAPRRSDIKAWKAIQKVYRLGHAFHTCGCNGPGFIPSSETEYQEYLRGIRDVYLNHAKNYETGPGGDSDYGQSAALYWRSRAAAIEAEMIA